MTFDEERTWPKYYEVKVTEHAEAAMREIAQYITFELLAPETAVNLMMVLRQVMEKLAWARVGFI